MRKKIYSIVASLLAISMIMGGCGKKDDLENNTADKTVVTSDFTSYYVAKRLVDGTGIAIDGIDFSQIDENEGLSGRDRNKIKNAVLFVDASFIGKSGYGIDEEDSNGLKFLHIGDFIERKENSKDENKIYTMPKLHITKNDNKDDDNNNNKNNGQQLIANPNANKDNNGDKGNNNSSNPPKSESDNSDKNNDNDKNNNNNDSDKNNNNNNQNNNSDKNKNNNNDNSSDKNNDDKNNNSNDNDDNKKGDKDRPSNNVTEKKEGLCFIFTDVGGSTPSGTCKDGYSISTCPVGHVIKDNKDSGNEYHSSIIKKIELMKSVAPEDEIANYYIIDNNAGGYVVLQFTAGLHKKYTVIDGIGKIRISTNRGYTNVICDTSVKSLVESYSSAKAYIPETNEKVAMANTVDFAKGYWLDVKNTRLLAEKILEKLIEIDPENKDKFEENYNKLDGELASLDDKYQYAVDSSENRVIFIGGGFVYKYMVDSYNIDYISIYDYSKQDTVTPTRLINFADLIDEYTIKYIVKDKLSTMDGITSVRSEINHNLNVVIIDTLEYVEDWENSDYFDLMDDNYIILKKALY